MSKHQMAQNLPLSLSLSLSLIYISLHFKRNSSKTFEKARVRLMRVSGLFF